MSLNANASRVASPLATSDLSNIVSAPPRQRWRPCPYKIAAWVCNGLLWVGAWHGGRWVLHALHLLK